ncbi:hypothetical protein Cgig2_019141 [Carnegiea gigantea]|uniref:Uncharacterized protein n=1 Tax=Carnegiea gigantea TaxID=171969 RepID=A0A9Q1JT81_9CARY|nr:hypothetical protein Cgig2_019141 [Carnegiea gigantea]
MDEWKTNCRGSSQIPAFGNWDYVNDLPITQYFECARQAGLIRYSSSSGECDPHPAAATADSYAVAPRSKQEGNMTMNGEKQGAGKVFNVTVTELPASKAAAGGKRHPAVKKQQQQFQHDAGSAAPQAQAQAQAQAQTRRPPKAVDEDLYKIPPELLKRKRRLGFISRCLVPPCAV